MKDTIAKSLNQENYSQIVKFKNREWIREKKSTRSLAHLNSSTQFISFCHYSIRFYSFEQLYSLVVRNNVQTINCIDIYEQRSLFLTHKLFICIQVTKNEKKSPSCLSTDLFSEATKYLQVLHLLWFKENLYKKKLTNQMYIKQQNNVNLLK